LRIEHRPAKGLSYLFTLFTLFTAKNTLFDLDLKNAQKKLGVGHIVRKACRKTTIARGGDGSIEIKQAIVRIEHLLVTNELSDRVMDLRDGDTKTIRNLLAYRKVGLEKETEEFWVPPTVFDKEFVVGVNKAELVKELQRLGWLLPPRPDGKATHTRSVNGKRTYLYIFQNCKKASEQGEQGEQGDSNPLPKL
jgi:putative DNA primase/helicase